MLKNKLSVILALIILTSSASRASAFSWTNLGSRESRTASRAAVRQTVQESRDTMLEAREALRSEWQAGSLEAMQKIGALHAIRLERRFAFYYARLKDILGRMDLRITALEGELGTAKLAKARSLWTAAGVKLEEAKTLGSAAVADFRSIEGTDLKSQRSEVFAARDDSRLALTAFKDATKLMKDAAQELHLVVNANKPSPTPQPSVSPAPAN